VIATPIPDMPAIPTAPLRMLGAEDAVKSLPCAALRLAAEGDGVRVSGFAPAGADLDRALGSMRGIGRVADRVTRVDRSACSVLEVLAATIRRTGDGAPPLAIRVDQPNESLSPPRCRFSTSISFRPTDLCGIYSVHPRSALRPAERSSGSPLRQPAHALSWQSARRARSISVNGPRGNAELTTSRRCARISRAPRHRSQPISQW
jgi:hypothetical protein